MRLFSRLSPLIAALLVLGTGPALAQWVAVGRWGDGNAFRYVQPGSWMARVEGSAVEVSAEGDNHQGRLTFRCEASRAGGSMVFEFYHGWGLDASIYAREQPGREPVRLEIDGQAFTGEVEYRPNDRLWIARDLLTPYFLDAFGRGLRMEFLNAWGERVTAFGLHGTGAARAAMLRICGI